MTQTFSAASIYGIIDRMDAGDIQRWLDFHKRLKHPPRFINVFTAAKFDQGPDVLRQVKNALPDTIPVWRGYDGKDAWGTPTNPEWTDANFYINLWNRNATSPAMAAGMWFARRVKPFLDVIRETGAIIHLLNEAQPLTNAPFETECIRLLGEEGIRAGAFAWTAGTPDWTDYGAQVISDEVAMAAKYKALVMCHEYAGIKPEEQNSLINRNQTLTQLFPADQQPDVFLGEFALAKATIKVVDGNNVIELDPDVGWRDMPVTEAQYEGFIDDTAKVWYVPKKIGFSLYSWPDWGKNGSFGVGNYQGLLDHLVDASAWMCFRVEDAMPTAPIETPVVIIPRPPEAQIGIRMRVKSIPTDFRNMRDTWNYQGKITGQLRPGDVARRFDIPIHTGLVSALSTGNWIYVEKLSDETVHASVVESGYVWNNRIIWENLVTSTQETPVVPPAAELPPPPPETMPDPPTPAPVPDPAQNHVDDPPVTPVKTKLRYSLEIDTTPDKHAIIEQAMMAILLSLSIMGQALGGANVSIVTEAA